MNILMLGIFDPSKNNASKVHFCEIANVFARLGHRVEALLPVGLSPKTVLDPKIRLCELPVRCDESLLKATMLSVLQLCWLFRVLKKQHDVMYVRWRLFPAWMLRLVARLKGLRPLVVTEHNGWVELEFCIQHGESVLSRFARWFQVADARSADQVVAVTDGIRDRLVESGVDFEQVLVQGNGTNIERFYPIAERSALKDEFLGVSGTVLGFMGSISKWQGLDDLLQAFELVAVDQADIYLLVIGSGMYEEKFKRRVAASPVAAQVIMRPHVAYEQANRWMNVMDVAFAPKTKALDSIGYSPLKIRDYAAAGLPVVSTRVRGIAELEPHGWLKTYDPDEPGGLSTLLRSMLEDRQELEAMGQRARAYAEAEFSWKEVGGTIARRMEKMDSTR